MHIFDQAVQATGAEEEKKGKVSHQVNISDEFSVNGNPNGGYLMALLARQMLNRTDKSTTPIITVNYLARTATGVADIMTQEISHSRQFNRFEARLIQENREILRAMGSFMADDLDCTLDRYEEEAALVAPLDECISFPPMPNFKIYDNVDIRIEPESALWLKGEKGTKSEHRGWLRFSDEREFDICGILLAADSFPPPIFATEGPVGWVPTIEMSVNVRNLPVGNWLKCRFRTRHITCGLLEEDGELWDEEGNLVAISRQIAQFRKGF